MAKTETAPVVKFTVAETVPESTAGRPAGPNPYTPLIDAVTKAGPDDTFVSNGKSATVAWPEKDGPVRAKVTAAAHAKGLSPRFKVSEDGKSCTVWTVPKVSRPRTTEAS